MAHTHFTRPDRVLLQKLKLSGKTNKFCADVLGFHPTTISRELCRGAAPTVTGYSVVVAQKHVTAKRLSANQQHRKLNKKKADKITSLIQQYYSPDQAGEAVGVSHSTVYRWLWQQSKQFIESMWQYLRHKKIRRKYGTRRREKQRELQKKRWIDTRPKGVDNRSRYGHWEGDTVRGYSHSGYLVTHVERKSGYLLAGLIPKSTKDNFRVCTEKLFETIQDKSKLTLTLDNGTEMNGYEELEKNTSITVYFAHPYHSWERGTNENTNGLLRQFFPKTRDFSTITQNELDHAVKLINTRPRKRHNYRSPEQLFKKKLNVAI